MSEKTGVAAWHAYIAGGNKIEALSGLVADDAVFHSPVVHSPQEGKAKVMAYLSAAAEALGGDSFHYVRELADGNDVLFEFETVLDGVHVNGIDLIRFDGHGKISDFKVMVRPIKALNKVWEVMAAQLEHGDDLPR